MPFSRREFLASAALGAAVGALETPPPLRAENWTTPKFILFDAFPIFDPGPVSALAADLFPGKGAALSAAWRTRQFEYQWLRALSRRYANFEKVTEDALVFAARQQGLDLSVHARKRLLEAYVHLQAWPEVPGSLRALKKAGFGLGFLSNMTFRMLDANIKIAGLEGLFDPVLSTDSVRAYKPDPRAYELGTSSLRLSSEEILFVAFAGWDAAGAKAFGYSTFWVNRLEQPMEELGVLPDGVGRTLEDLVEFTKKG